MKIKKLKLVHHPELTKEEIIKFILNPSISILKSQIIFWIVILTTFIIFCLTVIFVHYLVISSLFLVYLFIVTFLISGKTLENSDFDQKNLSSYLQPFKEYLACEGDRTKVNFLIDRIEAINGHYKKNNRVFHWSNIIYLSSFFSFSLTIIAVHFSTVSYPELPFIFIIILNCESWVISLLHWIRYVHIKNLQQSKLIFEKIYDTELDQIYKDLRRITLREIKNTTDDTILNSLKTWYDLYCGKYKFEKEGCQDLYYDNRLVHVKKPELNKFYNLLNVLRINLLNEKPDHNPLLMTYNKQLCRIPISQNQRKN